MIRASPSRPAAINNEAVASHKGGTLGKQEKCRAHNFGIDACPAQSGFIAQVGEELRAAGQRGRRHQSTGHGLLQYRVLR